MSKAKLKLLKVGRTNILHSDAECEVIRAALRRAEEALLCPPASAGTRRSRKLKDLPVTDEIRRYKIALSPHKKLPADVWLRIFLQLCCHHPAEFKSGGSGTSLSPLVVLSRVCSGWRQLLMSSPAIWSDVCVENGSRALSRATKLLSRAGNIPRSLKIVRERFLYEDDIISFPTPCRGISPYQTSVEDTPFFPPPPSFYQTPAEDIPILSSIYLTPVEDTPFFPTPFHQTPVEDTPFFQTPGWQGSSYQTPDWDIPFFPTPSFYQTPVEDIPLILTPSFYQTPVEPEDIPFYQTPAEDTLFHQLGQAPYLESSPVEELISLFPFRSLDIPFPIQFSKIPIKSLLPLEELICTDERGDERTSLSPHSLPNLECLIIGKSVRMPRFHHPRPFSTWPNLRKLVLHCRLPKFECLTILGDATRIEECTMRVNSDGEAESTVEGIVLPRLTTLKLDFRSDRDLVSFLDTLTLPNLTSFELGHGECDESTLHRLAKRSGMRDMETLIIFEAKVPLHIGTLLEIFPSLFHLGIHTRTTLDKSTMDRIRTGELGPRLRVLHLRGYPQFSSLFAVTDPELRRTTIRRQRLNEPKPISLLENVSVEACPRPLGKSEERRTRQLSYDEFEVQFCPDIGCRHAELQ